LSALFNKHNNNNNNNKMTDQIAGHENAEHEIAGHKIATRDK